MYLYNGKECCKRYGLTVSAFGAKLGIPLAASLNIVSTTESVAEAIDNFSKVKKEMLLKV